MNSEHIQTKTVKQYLLGTLLEPKASAIEERYFTDPLFFRQLRTAEIELIGDYLDGKLSPEEHTQFEGRYMAVPALREMVDRVSAQRVVSISVGPRWLRLVLASSIAMLVIAAFLLRKGSQPPQQAFHAPVSGISLFLEPGVTMGAASQAKLLKIPQSVAPISLIVELPGETAPADYIARLKKVEADRQPVLWSSNLTRSAPRVGGSQVTFTLDSSIVSPGDYILELATQGGKVRETYVFRAIPSSR